jgi:hypothetical protein
VVDAVVAEVDVDVDEEVVVVDVEALVEVDTVPTGSITAIGGSSPSSMPAASAAAAMPTTASATPTMPSTSRESVFSPKSRWRGSAPSGTS